MKTIGIIGTGSIGKHLTKLACANGFHNHIIISDKDKYKSYDIGEYYDIDNLDVSDTINICDILFLAVKPNQIKSLCEDIDKYNDWEDDKTIVSLAAGIPINKIYQWLGYDGTYDVTYDVIRCMPNTPISLREGSIVWYNPNNDNKENIDIIKYMTEGPYNLWVNNEELIDSATVVSGCLPAYISTVHKIYTDIAIEMGFKPSEAKQLVTNAFMGTSRLLDIMNSNDIIREVASKGGATESGLAKLKEDGLDKLLFYSASDSLTKINSITHSLD